MRQPSPTHTRVPLAEERLALRKRRVATGRVRVRTVVDEKTRRVRDSLDRDLAEIERVPIGIEVDEVPEWRREGDVLVVPLVEEELVLEKKLVLKEELRLRIRRSSEVYESKVKLRSMRAVIERTPAPEAGPRRPRGSKRT
jgi:uncharacterized protein (TIGR02271 family)